MDEVRKCISSLKNGKAVGLDSISNEMLKYGQFVLLPCITAIFNLVYNSSIFPAIWAEGYITPIFKSGNTSDPANYRGISIMSNMGKLCNLIINKRLNEYLERKNIIHKNQIGFSKNSRTSDHMLVLKTLIDQCFNEKKKLYTCFIDFKKAFDSVPHEKLMCKLQQAGINGKCLEVIKNMYSKIRLSVKTDNALTDSFPAKTGVRQGDVLSPNLFKIYVNDLCKYLDDPSCCSPSLKDLKLALLMYADDIVLLSETEKGLQSCINKLERFCTDSGLEINLKKSKVLIFNKAGRKSKATFYFKNEELEQVTNYKYLGVYFQCSGSFATAKSDLYNKAQKAIYKLFSCFSSELPSCKTAMHIFDHTILPILSYGCDIWGVFNSKGRKATSDKEYCLENVFKDFVPDKLHIKFGKRLLGVGKRATNNAILGELGRFPLYINILSLMVKSWHRIANKAQVDEKSLLVLAYSVSDNLRAKGYDSWCSNIKFILENLELGNIFHNPNSIDSKSLGRLIRIKLEDRFSNKWKKELVHGPCRKGGNSGSKLRSYVEFKYFIGQEPYLHLVKNQSHRRALTKFRISAHTLAIEQGRYKNIPPEKRICPNCNLNKVEDELHFLIECPNNEFNRNEFLKSCEEHIPNTFFNLTDRNKFIWLMSNETKEIVVPLAKLIFQCFQNRL